MGTKFRDFFAALAAPFSTEEVKRMKDKEGRVLKDRDGRDIHYVTARTVMNRLDEAVGPENWWDEYATNQNSVLCRLSIRIPDEAGTVVTKCDAGGYAGMANQGDDDMSGYSTSLKRAAARFGVARYLYKDGVPPFVRESLGMNGAQAEPDQPEHREPPRQQQRQDQAAQQRKPASYDEVHAQNQRQQSNGNGHHDDRRQAPAQGQGGNGNGNGAGSPPRTGKALFAFVKDMETKHEVALLTYLNKWAAVQEFPKRMIDFDADQVALAYGEAQRKIQSLKAAAAN